MPATVLLTIVEGSLKGKAFNFPQRMLCSIGRSSDCYLQLPNDEENITVSRRHCLLDVDPPEVRISDLGSLNGTFVNGRDIGHRDKRTRASDLCVLGLPEQALHAGDEVRIGNTVFRVDVAAMETQSESSPLSTAESDNDMGNVADKRCAPPEEALVG